MYSYHPALGNLNSINIQSASELGGLGVGKRQRRSKMGRVDETHAEAEGLRAFGRIIQQLNSCARGHACLTPKQRAGRRRAACITLNDGLTDGTEDSDANGLQTFGETDPNDPDTDGDGLADGWKDQQVWNSSSQQFESCSDGTAGVFDAWEGEDSDKDGEVDKDANETMLETSPIMKDSDGDGLWDGDEVKPEMISEDDVANPNGYVTDALKGDTDNDGISDYMEIIGWNMTTYWEATFEVRKDTCMVYSDPTDSDTDDDGLLDGDEYVYTGDPTDSDSDDDGIDDKAEVNVGSKPGDSDGIAPIIYYINCWVDPIVKMGNNGIKFLSGIKLKITVNASDSSGVHYVELEINNKIERRYLQDGQLQTNITNVTINLTFDYPFAEQDRLIIKVVDYYGNVNESGMIPDDYWPNFRGQNWVDPYVKLKTTGKRYKYSNNKNIQKELPTSLKYDIKKKLKDYIQFYLTKRINNAYKNQKVANNRAYIRAIKLSYKEVIYNGIFLHTLVKMFLGTKNFGVLKTNIWYLSQSCNLNPYYKNALHKLLEKLHKDINSLQRVFKNNPKCTKDLKKFISDPNKYYSIPKYLKTHYQWFFNTKDYHIPDIIAKAYGLHKLHRNEKRDKTANLDNDKDGIKNRDEIKIVFRPSYDAKYNYKSGWITIYKNEGKLLKLGYHTTIKYFKINKKRENSKLEFVRKGTTWNNKKYLLFQYVYGGKYLIYVITKDMKNGRKEVSIYKEEKASNYVISPHDVSMYPNAITYFSENRLCPKANPIGKDIFVEINGMREKTKSYTWKSNKPNALAKYFWHDTSRGKSKCRHYFKYQNKIIESFDKQGIYLHIDDGSGYGEDGGDQIFHKNYLRKGYIHLIKKLATDDTRLHVYHQCIFAHKRYKNYYEGVKKRTFFGGAYDYTIIIYAEETNHKYVADVFMHELGHTLFLEHPSNMRTSGMPNTGSSSMYSMNAWTNWDYTKNEWKKVHNNLRYSISFPSEFHEKW
jgi:hypothetical protein